MKKTILTHLLILLSNLSYSQSKVQYIDLGKSHHKMNLSFSIDTIIDARVVKILGFTDRKTPIKMKRNFSESISAYFYSLSPSENQLDKYTIVVNNIEIFEGTNKDNFGYTYASDSIDLSFFADNKLILRTKTGHISYGDKPIQRHEANLKKAIKNALNELENLINPKVSLTNENIINDEKLTNDGKQTKTMDNNEPKSSRNIPSFGYGIGGINHFGFDYEIRVADQLGIHFGVGIIGFNAGLRIHANQNKKSPFFSIDFKDANFGDLKTLDLGFGVILPFSRNTDFGLILQIGYSNVMHVSNGYRQDFFDGKDVKTMMTYGIGFSF